jgi:hypothetical protein
MIGGIVLYLCGMLCFVAAVFSLAECKGCDCEHRYL